MRTILIKTIFIIALITATAIVFLASFKGYDIKVAFIIMALGFIPGLLLKNKYQNTNVMKWVQILSFALIVIYYLYVMYF